MSDELGNEQEQGGDENESPVIRQLRAKLKAQDKTIAELQAGAKARAFRDVGLNPDKGVGKIIASNYDGDLDAEALRTWMADNEIELPATNGEQQEPVEQGLSEEQSAEIASATRAAGLSQVGEPVGPQDPHARYEEAEAAGDIQGMMSAVNEQAQAWRAAHS